CSIVCFFFSSRRRHTRSKRDWSSDVCSSDLFLRAMLDLSYSSVHQVIKHLRQIPLVWPKPGVFFRPRIIPQLAYIRHHQKIGMTLVRYVQLSHLGSEPLISCYREQTGWYQESHVLVRNSPVSNRIRVPLPRHLVPRIRLTVLAK